MVYGYGRLCDAAASGSLDKLKELKKLGTQMDEKYKDGSNALHFAAQYGRLECMKFLIHECGFDIAAPGHLNWAPISFCISYDRTECAHYLLSLGVKLPLDDECIEWAAVHGELSVLINQYPGCINYIARIVTNKALRSAGSECKKIYQPEIRRFVDVGANVTDEMFELTVKWNDVKYLERLFELDTLPAPYRDARLTAEGQTLIQVAARWGSQECLAFLLDKSIVMIDYEIKCLNGPGLIDGTAVRLAIKYDHPKSAEILLAAGASTKLQFERKQTILHVAVLDGYLASVEILLKYDPSLVNLQDLDGDTALHKASLRQNMQIIDLLINKGADKTIKNNFGRTPLQLLAVGD